MPRATPRHAPRHAPRHMPDAQRHARPSIAELPFYPKHLVASGASRRPASAASRCRCAAAPESSNLRPL
eukprot:5486516-Prymnesium_polylepis.1